MHSVMDGVEVQLLCQLGELGLAGGCAVLGFDAHLEVLLGGVGHDFAQQFGELGGVISLFVGWLFPVQTDLGVAFAMCDACHCQIHADFGALAHEVGAEAFHVLFGIALCDNSEERLEVFAKIRALSKIQASPYAYVRKWFLENYANYAEDPEFDANGFVIVKTKSQMEAEKKAKAQEEAKRAEEIAAAETQEETEVQEQEIEEVAA